MTTQWFQFMDMHSGGGRKVPGGEYIYLAANDGVEARDRFEQIYGRSPLNVSCETCGEDYSISCHESLSVLTRFERGSLSVPEYVKAKGVIFVDPADAS